MTVPLKAGEGGLKQSSMVNLAQILTVDQSRLQRRVGMLSRERMGAVNGAITTSLDVA